MRNNRARVPPGNLEVDFAEAQLAPSRPESPAGTYSSGWHIFRRSTQPADPGQNLPKSDAECNLRAAGQATKHGVLYLSPAPPRHPRQKLLDSATRMW